MAAAPDPSSVSIGIPTPRGPIEAAIDLKHSPGLRVHLYIDVLATSLLVFLASASDGAGPAGTSMGSLVYAMPDVCIRMLSQTLFGPTFLTCSQRYNPSQPMSTVLYRLPSTVDFATRVAKALVRRLGKPCYVGSSVNLSMTAGGGSIDEEVEVFKAVFTAIIHEAGKPRGSDNHVAD